MDMKNASDKESVLNEMADKVVDENKEGFEKLANEEIAEKRRRETIVSKIWRDVRRRLGFRKTKAKTIDLN